MPTITEQASLRYHAINQPGKIEVIPTKPYCRPEDLALAYSPGVAAPVNAISINHWDAYRYTNKGNLVAVISNGTAVLGLGNVGALSSKPVMEGKAMLFKIYGNINAYDIEIDETDPDKFISIVQAIAPTFGGINLEDIKAPECFYIEEKLRGLLDIPVMHDDQHGTSIVVSAGVLNALEIAEKTIEEARIVINGAGAAAIATAHTLIAIGVARNHITMLDRKGVINTQREDLNKWKSEFATSDNNLHTLADALQGADVFIGLSEGNILNETLLESMAHRPIIFALANPEPEIDYYIAKKLRPDSLVATGRTDTPNQINNVLGFPYLFRGALDTLSYCINQEMKLAAIYALSKLAKRPVPADVCNIYGGKFSFGPDYFIPKPNDKRLIVEISSAVAQAAMLSGVARKNIMNWNQYRNHLHAQIMHEAHFCRDIFRHHSAKNTNHLTSENRPMPAL